MKIFIWEDVLRDYTAGMAIGYGNTLEEVLEDFEKKDEKWISDQLGKPTKIIDCDTDKTMFTTYVYGGG